MIECNATGDFQRAVSALYTRYQYPNKIPDSVVAKAYADASKLTISWMTHRKLYGFRDLIDGHMVICPWPSGVSSYRALYRAMLQYVASGRKRSK